MKKFGLVVLVVLTVLFAVGNASAVMLPMTNGGFETAPAAGFGVWTTVIPGWTYLAGSTTPVRDDAGIVCPDGGTHAVIVSNQTSVALANYTTNVIKAGYTYTAEMDGRGGSVKIPSVLLRLVAVNSLGVTSTLGMQSFYPADYAVGSAWKTYTTPSYTADATYAGQTLMVYFQFAKPVPANSGYGPYVGAVRISEVPEPATMALLGIGGLMSVVRRKK